MGFKFNTCTMDMTGILKRIRERLITMYDPETIYYGEMRYRAGKQLDGSILNDGLSDPDYSAFLRVSENYYQLIYLNSNYNFAKEGSFIPTVELVDKKMVFVSSIVPMLPYFSKSEAESRVTGKQIKKTLIDINNGRHNNIGMYCD